MKSQGDLMKNSFILHIDSLCILDKMSDEMAGKFIKIIFQYQKTKELPEMDFTMEMIITPFTNQFFRDEKGYEKVIERNRENGRMGGRPKKEPKKPSGLKKTQHNPKNPSEPKKADSDSDSVNDSVNDSGSKKDRNVIPTLEEVTVYFNKNGYTEQAARKAFDYYNSANWHDSKGNKVKAWKQKMQGVWFTDANKIQENNVVSMPARTFDPYNRKNYWNEEEYEAAMKKLNQNAAS